MEGICAYEWELENFSCWNAEIHGEAIQCGEGCMSLYPRGRYLEVKIDSFVDHGICEVTVIASDGTIICTLSKEGRDKEGFYIYSRGPGFSEVVSRIKELEDRLLLRWQTSGWPAEHFMYFRSIICAYDASVRIDSRFLGDLEIEDWRNVAVIKTPHDFECRVSACKSDTGIPKYKLKLPATTSGEVKLLVRTTYSIPKAHGITKIFEEDFLLEEEERVFSFLQPEEDANDEKIFLTFKFITGRYEKFYHSSNCPRTVGRTKRSPIQSAAFETGGGPLVQDH